MAINYARLFNRRITPQSQPIPGSTQVPNSAGGYAWQVDDWTRFDRFLVLGAEGATYYIGERDLIKENHGALVRCIQANWPARWSSISSAIAGRTATCSAWLTRTPRAVITKPSSAGFCPAPTASANAR